MADVGIFRVGWEVTDYLSVSDVATVAIAHAPVYVAQSVVEVIRSPTGANALVAQDVIEVIRQPVSKALIYQAPVEVIETPTTTKALVYQAPVEVIGAEPSQALVYQAPVEVIYGERGSWREKAIWDGAAHGWLLDDNDDTSRDFIDSLDGNYQGDIAHVPGPGFIGGSIASSFATVADFIGFSLPVNLVRFPIGGSASYTANSQYNLSYAAGMAADGVYADPGEWACNGNPVNAWWRCDWTVPQTISQITTVGRATDNFDLCHVEFSDGSTVSFDTPILGGRIRQEWNFSPRTVSWFRIVSDGGGAPNTGNPGFAEIEAGLVGSRSVVGLPVGNSDRTIEAWVRLDSELKGYIMAYGRQRPGEMFALSINDEPTARPMTLTGVKKNGPPLNDIAVEIGGAKAGVRSSAFGPVIENTVSPDGNEVISSGSEVVLHGCDLSVPVKATGLGWDVWVSQTGDGMTWDECDAAPGGEWTARNIASVTGDGSQFSMLFDASGDAFTRPFVEPSSNWAATSYDSSTWIAPVAFQWGWSNSIPTPSGTHVPDMAGLAWMWDAPPAYSYFGFDYENSHGPHYFRKEFALNGRNAITGAFARIHVGDNDSYSLYVNETLVGTGGFAGAIYDVASLLYQGRNVIAIEGYNPDRGGGVLFRLDVLWDGGSLSVVSDATWARTAEVRSDINVVAHITGLTSADGLIGPCALDADGNGRAFARYSDGKSYVIDIAGYALSGDSGQGRTGVPPLGDHWLHLKRADFAWSGRYSSDGTTWSKWNDFDTDSRLISQVGILRAGTGGGDQTVGLERFGSTDASTEDVTFRLRRTGLGGDVLYERNLSIPSVRAGTGHSVAVSERTFIDEGPTDGKYVLTLQSATDVRCDRRRFRAGSVKVISDGEWHHIAASFSASAQTVSFFVDGYPAGAAHLGTLVTAASSTASIGRLEGAAYPDVVMGGGPESYWRLGDAQVGVGEQTAIDPTPPRSPVHLLRLQGPPQFQQTPLLAGDPSPSIIFSAPPPQEFVTNPNGETNFDGWDTSLSIWGWNSQDPDKHAVLSHSGDSPVGHAYRDTVVSDGPVSYYRLGESGSLPQDYMGRNNCTSMPYGTPPAYNVTGAVAGDGDGAISLNGSVAILIPPSTSLAHTLSQASSTEMWVLRGPAGGTIVSRGRLGHALSLRIASDGKVWFANDWNWMSSYAAMSMQWHHLVVVVAQNDIRFYLDGKQWQSGNNYGIPVSLPDNWLVIGCDHEGFGDGLWGYSDATLDEVALYDYALSPEQVARHYEAGISGLAPGTVSAESHGSLEVSFDDGRDEGVLLPMVMPPSVHPRTFTASFWAKWVSGGTAHDWRIGVGWPSTSGQFEWAYGAGWRKYTADWTCPAGISRFWWGIANQGPSSGVLRISGLSVSSPSPVVPSRAFGTMNLCRYENWSTYRWDFSVEVWGIFPDQPSRDSSIVYAGTPDPSGWGGSVRIIQLAHQNVIECRYTPQDGLPSVVQVDITPGVVQHIVVTFDVHYWRVYHDGELRGEVANSYTHWISSYFCLNYDPIFGYGEWCQLSDVAVYYRPLSGAEVYTHWKTGSISPTRRGIGLVADLYGVTVTPSAVSSVERHAAGDDFLVARAGFESRVTLHGTFAPYPLIFDAGFSAQAELHAAANSWYGDTRDLTFRARGRLMAEPTVVVRVSGFVATGRLGAESVWPDIALVLTDKEEDAPVLTGGRGIVRTVVQDISAFTATDAEDVNVFVGYGPKKSAWAKVQVIAPSRFHFSMAGTDIPTGLVILDGTLQVVAGSDDLSVGGPMVIPERVTNPSCAVDTTGWTADPTGSPFGPGPYGWASLSRNAGDGPGSTTPMWDEPLFVGANDAYNASDWFPYLEAGVKSSVIVDTTGYDDTPFPQVFAGGGQRRAWISFAIPDGGVLNAQIDTLGTTGASDLDTVISIYRDTTDVCIDGNDESRIMGPSYSLSKWTGTLTGGHVWYVLFSSYGDEGFTELVCNVTPSYITGRQETSRIGTADDIVSTTCLDITTQAGGCSYAFYPLAAGQRFLANCKYTLSVWLKTSSDIHILLGRAGSVADSGPIAYTGGNWERHSVTWLSTTDDDGVWLAVGEPDGTGVSLSVAGVSVKRHWPSQIPPSISGNLAPGQMYLVGTARMEDEP
jgi:hypothetical protein